MPDWVQMIGLALKEGSPSIVQYAKEYFQGDELEKTQAIQKASFARMHEVLLDGPASTETEHGDDCPSCKVVRGDMNEGKKVVGHRTWLLAHGTVDALPDGVTEREMGRVKVFLTGILTNFPCKSCADHMASYLRVHPLDYSSKKALERSLCRAHNAVRDRLGQPITHECR